MEQSNSHKVEPGIEIGREETTKKAWTPPLLTPLGLVRDLVQGMGKSASNLDMDPMGTGKQGMG